MIDVVARRAQWAKHNPEYVDFHIQDARELLDVYEEFQRLRALRDVGADELRVRLAKSISANERASRLRGALANLVQEVDFVISGGDDPYDRCTECNLAGIGMLRDARRIAEAVLMDTRK